MDKVSIVIPIYVNDRQILKMTIDCIADALNTHGVNKEIIVVDDGSKTPVKKIIPKLFPDVILLSNEKNMGFASTVNKGIEASSGNLVCLLNNDIRLPNPRWLKIMVDSLEQHSLDMTAPAGGRMDSGWNYVPGEAERRGDKFAYLVGWCLLVRKVVFDKIGLMPTEFGKGFWEDVLFGYRAARARFKMDITEGTGVVHMYHTTFKKEGFDINKEYQEKRKIFLDIIKRGL